MGHRAKGIVMMIALSFLTALVLAPTPHVGPGDALSISGGPSAAAVSPLEGYLTARTPEREPSEPTAAPVGDCEESSGSSVWPTARFTERTRPHRAGAGDTWSGQVPIVLAVTVVDSRAGAGLAEVGRLVDLRALSAPCVLRVIRS